MGLADIIESELESNVVRNSISQRIFNLSFEDRVTTGEDSEIINWIWNNGKRLVGFITANAGKLLNFSLSGLWGWFTSTLQYIWNFNWNVTDKEIDNQINALWAALGGLLGGTVGNAIGYLGCGVLPGAVIFSFNEPLGAYILEQVSEEMAEELLANISGLARYAFMSATQALIMWGFKNVRKFIKSQSDLIGRLFGDNAEKLVKAWGAEGSKPWSFAIALDNAVESIPNEFVRNFVEELLEEAWEGCVEAGYVVANSIDSYLAGEKLRQQNQPPMGRNRYIEIKPDRTIDDERIILAGPTEILKTSVVETLTTYQMWEDRDIGTFVGSPIDEFLRAKPRSISLCIQFYSRQQPPWSKQGSERIISATCSVPDIDPSKLDWERIKLACGGVNGYLYGRFRVTGFLDNGRQMAVFASTSSEAEDRMKALLALSTSKLLKKPTITEDRTEDTTGTYVKQPVRIYPAYFTIMNQYRVPGAPSSGIPINGKRYIRKKDRIDLWTTEKPDDFEARIVELLKKPGADTNPI